ncbi:hypothetical protein Tsubulata_018011 [Turnera subulata]|uniref:BZIP domain-containing protein n=1 Tax=Turnera subulata TaxID=218843 RepID=A0A9Q0GBX6_9ROSI|nr:hypothetical protein Tsubulata_018011 [Turnera subulata]
MASSKVMANASTANPDLPRQHSPSLCPSFSSLLTDLQNHTTTTTQLGSSPHLTSDPSMDDFLKNIYSSPTPGDPATPSPYPGASIPRSDDPPAAGTGKTVDDVWKEIVAGGADQRRAAAAAAAAGGATMEEMTLEDFLTKAGAVREEDVRGMGIVPVGPPPGVVVGGGGAAGGGYGVDAKSNGNSNGNGNSQFAGEMMMIEGTVVGTGGGRGAGRGKRRAVEEAPLDKATQQKQRRMIKNRESAARSRERKQAYTVELESLVTQLEEENARLLKEEADQTKERYKQLAYELWILMHLFFLSCDMQLMANLIPVIEKRRPPRVLRRVQSMQW